MLLAVGLSACQLTLPGTSNPGGGGSPAPGGQTQTQGGTTLGTPASGPVSGLILGVDGKPAVNVTVTAFLNNTNPLVGNNGAALVGNSGGALVGNSGGALTTYRSTLATVLAAGISANTDAGGRYVISPPAVGDYNIEAKLNDSTKGWQAAVAFKGANIDIGSMQLKPVGHISGKVVAADARVTDLIGTRVFIPGSSYVAEVRTDGTYTMSNVPVADFDVWAYNDHLGTGRLPAGTSIAVKTGQTVAAPNITLDFHLPEITKLTRVDNADPTDNAAVGAQLDIHGDHFGQEKGLSLSVRFPGVAADKPELISEKILRVKVPSGASNGALKVEVGGRASGPITFRLLKSLDMTAASYAFGPGKTEDMMKLVIAKDPEGFQLPFVFVPDGKLYPPNITFASNKPALAPINAVTGLLTTIGTGNLTVSVKAGDNLFTSCQVIIQDGPLPTPTPAASAAPTAAPTAVPTAVPTAFPTAVPTAAPTAAPTSAPTAAPTAAPKPFLTSVTPLNGGPGTKVTIKGSNFGIAGNLAIAFNEAGAQNPSRVDDTTLEAFVPFGATKGNIVVTTDAGLSNGLAFTVIQSLSLDKGEIDLLVGANTTYEVTAIDTGGNIVAFPLVLWTMSGQAAAGDGFGKATAMAAGESTITVTSGSLSKAAKIKVFAVTAVGLNKQTLTLNAWPESGNPDAAFKTQETVVASVAASDRADREVTWTSSDPTQVTVDANGLVKTTRGASEGTVIITAKSKDNPSKSASVTVTVTILGGINVGVQ